jgi:hypothetical protein
MSISVLGKLITITNAARDAEHVAICPAMAAEDLFPGQDVGFVNPPMIEPYLVGTKVGKLVGIVDPFLKHKIMKGEEFWLCMYPNTCKALRHAWTHPEIENVIIVNGSTTHDDVKKKIVHHKF